MALVPGRIRGVELSRSTKGSRVHYFQRSVLARAVSKGGAGERRQQHDSEQASSTTRRHVLQAAAAAAALSAAAPVAAAEPPPFVVSPSGLLVRLLGRRPGAW